MSDSFLDFCLCIFTEMLLFVLLVIPIGFLLYFVYVVVLGFYSVVDLYDPFFSLQLVVIYCIMRKLLSRVF